MIKNKDIVITGLQPWNFSLGSNVANIARTLSMFNRVLFVNYAFDRLTLLRQRKEPRVQTFINKRKTIQLQLELVNPNLWILTPGILLESINKIKSRVLFDFFNRVNGNRLGKEIKKAIDQLHFNDFYLFTDSDFYRCLYLKEILRPQLFIYYIRDNLIATDYYRIHGKRIEEKIMRKADLVITNSHFLANYASSVNPNAAFVGQGCDLRLYNHNNVMTLPLEVSNLKTIYKRVVGYIGALKSIRIDLELVSYLASSRPDWAFLLVGPEDEIFKSSPLHSIKNIIFVGAKKESELPSYIDFLDVAINPQKVNDITKGNYPRKIDEYLAMGKPVVATRTEAMEFFEGYVYLAKDYQEFLSGIEKAIIEDGPEISASRIEYASQHSWENNILQIEQQINRLLNIHQTDDNGNP